jgi:hypothetical protein
MVDTAKRHQIRRQSAIRDSALHERELNPGIRIVQKRQIFFCAVRGTQFHFHIRCRQYPLIAFA